LENNQLGFLLKKDGEEDYTASVGVLEDQQILEIAKFLQESKASYMNASEIAKENTWYRVEAKISGNSTNARLYEMNNTLLENTAPGESLTNDEMGILMAYPPNSILAFRNLKVEPLDQPDAPSPLEEERNRTCKFDWPFACAVGAMLLVIGLGAVVHFGKRRKLVSRIKTSIVIKTFYEFQDNRRLTNSSFKSSSRVS
jgi:hypothetical protein